jgi:hypothetical protein
VTTHIKYMPTRLAQEEKKHASWNMFHKQQVHASCHAPPPPNPQINYSKKCILEFFSPKLARFTKVLLWAKCCQVVRSQCPILHPLWNQIDF